MTTSSRPRFMDNYTLEKTGWTLKKYIFIYGIFCYILKKCWQWYRVNDRCILFIFIFIFFTITLTLFTKFCFNHPLQGCYAAFLCEFPWMCTLTRIWTKCFLTTLRINSIKCLLANWTKAGRRLCTSVKFELPPETLALW